MEEHTWRIERLTWDEREAWARHCEKCFAAKYNPPKVEYFLRHLGQDPWLDLRCVYVLKKSTNDILSTLRLFDRTIFVQGQTLRVYGVGEVCTAPESQGQGLATQLMRHVKDTVPLASGIEAMMLHCKGNFTGFYAKFGFQQCQTEYTRMVLDSALAGEGILRVQQVDLLDHADTISALSNTFNARFAGAVVRSPEYVRKWLRTELGTTVTAAFNEHGSIFAHAAVKRKGDSIFLTDFSTGEYLEDGDAMYRVLQSLVCAAVGILCGNEGAASSESVHQQERGEHSTTDSVLVPRPLLRLKFQNPSIDFVDDGWMYRLENPMISLDVRSALVPEESNNRVFWMVDSF